MQGARIHVASGNFVTARPLGVRDGVDYCFTGEVRRIDACAIHTWLDHKAIVLLGTLGYSPTGEVFNLSAGEIAVATAIALQADKLLLLGEGADVVNDRGELIRQLTLGDVNSEPAFAKLPSDARRQLDHALRACRGGVRRAHLLDRRVDGALLRELYTRDGVGTMIAADLYERLRQATIDDIGGILELIAPLEIDGTLVRRSRELLEMEINRFTILERDGTTIGCAALYAFHEERLGELACLAIHTDYRRSNRADALLQHIETRSRQLELEKLFVLTTRAAHWFQERGFVAAEITDLPVSRQLLYNLQRRSKVFIKPLN
jgi:amino-acid N-acetyltransferase